MMASSLFLLCLSVLAQDSGPASQSAAADLPRFLIYSGALTLVEEVRTVTLPAGRSKVRIDFVRGNADLTTLDVFPLDHPDKVRVVAQTGRNDLGNALFLELESDEARRERLRLTYAARGLSAGVRYEVAFDAAGKTLDLAQELEVTNTSGESFAGVSVSTVFGDVKTVQPNIVLHGRAPDPAEGAPAGLPPQPLRQDLAEHTVVSFGPPVALPDGITVRRRTLEKMSLPLAIEYRLDSATGTRVTRRLKVANREGERLGGITLQPGGLNLVERTSDGPERFVTLGALPHLPAGKELEIDAGFASDIVVERDLLDTVRSDLAFGEYNRALISYSVEETYRVEVRNQSDEARQLVITERVGGTDRFEVLESSVPVTNKTSDLLEFRTEVPARGTLELRYRLKKIDVKV
ncbi:MAG: hypothetical protein AB1486_11305 [Planctomycetota bacterium]